MKVSIITVCFNSVQTIEQTIQSVVRQTYKNVEYIIIDGGSSDGTIDIIQKYDDKIAFWVSEPDNGIYDAMNKGIEHATGDIIGIINSDDWYEISTIEKVAECFQRKEIDAVHGDVGFISDAGNYLWRGKPDLRDEAFFYLLPYNSPTVFVKKWVYERFGKFNINYLVAADYELMLRLYSNGILFYYLSEELAYFRLGGVSTSRRLWRCEMERRQILKKFLESMRSISEKNEYDITNERNKMLVEHFIDKRLDRKENQSFVNQFFQNYFKEKMKYVLFGAGITGIWFYEWCLKKRLPIHSFVDNFRHGKNIGKLEINMPDTLNDSKDKTMVIITMMDDAQSVINQLKSMGFVYHKDFLLYTDIIDEIRRVYIKEKMLYIFEAPQHNTNKTIKIHSV